MKILGKKIPKFTLLTDENNDITEEYFMGTWTILFAYPKNMTPGCTRESCDFQMHYTSLKRMKVQIIGINKDSTISHQKFKTAFNLRFPLISDPDKKLLRPLGAFGTKIMYGKPVQGIIRSTFLINPKGIVVYVWAKVRVKDHVEQVVKITREFL